MNHTDFFDNGFTDLIPIRRGDKRPTGRWMEIIADREKVARWEGDNLGLRTANFPTLDIDVKDAGLVDAIGTMLHGMYGTLPFRVGSAPKRAYVFRLEGDVFPKRRLVLEKDGARHAVELLAGGQYVVVNGVHPSGRPYTWVDGDPVAAALPTLSAMNADALLEMIGDLAERHGFSVVGRSTSAFAEDAPDQASLKGTLEDAARYLRAIPNDYADRDEYLKIGFALKAAIGEEHPVEAAALWHEWCAGWTLGVNDDATIARDWAGLRGPFRVGIDFLRLTAQDRGLPVAQEVFEPLVEEEAPAEEGISPFTDAWLATAFVARHADEYRYCEETKKWLRWDGVKWEPGSQSDAQHAVAAIAQRAAKAATKAEHRKWALSLKAVLNSTSYAALSPALRVALDALDADPWVLNTPGGLVDLRDGAVAPCDPARLCTRSTLVAPRKMPTPKWDAFLLEAAGGDPALVRYLQRLAGYCLTGVTTEHTFAFLWGPGGNGKGVFLNTLTRVLGTYAAIAPMNTFTASYGDRHPTELAALAGARMVTAQETEEGRSWDEAKVKSITGGDPISARFMRGDFFTYVPQFKLLFAGNHRPHTKALDDAMRRRLHLVPFTHKPVVVNHRLQDELTEELPGILAWAIEGCLAWQAQGLTPPAAVLEETQAYFREEDLLGRWLEDRTRPSEVMTTANDLYNDWCRWCSAAGEPHGTLKAFAMALRGRGIEQVRSRAARGYRLALNVGTGPTSVSLTGPVDLLEDDELDDLQLIH